MKSILDFVSFRGELYCVLVFLNAFIYIIIVRTKHFPYHNLYIIPH